MKEDLKNYIEQLLENVADEVNVKQIVLDNSYASSVYNYDTVWRKSIGLDEEWPLYALIFTGEVVEDMKMIREMVNVGLRQRAEAKIKVRQPLSRLTIDLQK